MSDDGKSNSLRLSEEGEDGLEELVTCFGSSKIQYGLATIDVQDGKGKKVVTFPEKTRAKMNTRILFQELLIIWQPDGAPILRKSACAHHVTDVST